MDKGGVTFDKFTSHLELLAERDLWLNTLKNLSAAASTPQVHDSL